MQALITWDKTFMSAKHNATIGGFGLGTLLAVALSWGANHSIVWAIVHGVCGWFYVVYYWLFK